MTNQDACDWTGGDPIQPVAEPWLSRLSGGVRDPEQAILSILERYHIVPAAAQQQGFHWLVDGYFWDTLTGPENEGNGEAQLWYQALKALEGAYRTLESHPLAGTEHQWQRNQALKAAEGAAAALTALEALDQQPPDQERPPALERLLEQTAEQVIGIVQLHTTPADVRPLLIDLLGALVAQGRALGA